MSSRVGACFFLVFFFFVCLFVCFFCFCFVFFNLLTRFIEISVFHLNKLDPDQTPRSAASDQSLHCLSMSFMGCWALWVKIGLLYLKKKKKKNLLKLRYSSYELVSQLSFSAFTL